MNEIFINPRVLIMVKKLVGLTIFHFENCFKLYNK